MFSLLKNKVLITIFGIVFLYAILTMFSGVEQMIEFYKNLELFYLLPIISITLFSMFIRSIIQRYLLNKIGIKISIKESYCLFISALSMVVTPGGAGLVVKSLFIQRKYGHSTSKSMPIVLAERFYDFLGVVAVIIFTLFLIFSIESFIIVLVSSIFLIILIFLIKNKNSQSIIKSVIRKIKFLNKRIPDDSEFYSSMDKIFKNKIILTVGLSIIALTFLDGLVFYFGFLAFKVDLGYFHSVQIFYTSILYGAITFIPGGVGVTEVSFIGLLSKYGIEFALATSIIVFLRLTTIWFLTGLGYITSFFFLKKTNFR